jgi:2,3-bisphosphoglycerate-independent phosphoglycerate mutase
VARCLERLDAELLEPLREAVAALQGRLAVCPDHGTDPHTGRHDPAPVPGVVWGEGVIGEGPDVLSERAVQGSPVRPPDELIPAPEAVEVAV